MDYEILKYSDDFEDHIDEIARLKTLNWGLDLDVFRSYVKWNYLDRPHSRPPIIYFVRVGEEIVAMRGAYETTWRVGDGSESFNASCSADFLILTEYRNKGLYNDFTNYITEDLDNIGSQYYFSFNATPINYIGSLSTGWKSVGKINIMRKQFRTKRSQAIMFAKKLAGPYARKLLRKTGMNLILKRRDKDNSQRIDMIYQSPRSQLPSRILLENKPRPGDMALLVNSTLPKNKITLVRDETFFRWRYNNPLSKYLFLYWYDDGLKGYLVLQSHLYSLESGGTHNIFELEATNSSIKIELLKALNSIINDGSISIWASMLDQRSYDYLASKGFKADDSPKSVQDPPRTILIRETGKHNKKMEFQGLNLLDTSSWDLKMIYMHDH